MWKDKLKEVIYILENSDINEIEIRFWFRKIKVTKKPPIINSDISNLSPNIVSSTTDKPSAPLDKEDIISPKADANTFTVRSPMPGTFYSSPDPDSDSFIQINGSVSEGDTMCIV
jgi:biotin carboxyl carrier protein